MEAKAKIRQFVQMLLEKKGDSAPFVDDTSLLLSGRLSSVDAVEIVVLLEQDFSVDFTEIGFDQAHLDSIDSILAIIEQTKAAK